MSGRPAISVLLPTWNTFRFLPAAVNSILGQQLEDFEVVIVDDGSTDQTMDYLRSLPDARVRVLQTGANIGVTAALNVGLAACRGRYIARMDSDDISEPDRLKIQFELLEANADIGIVGSSRLIIDEEDHAVSLAPAITDDLSIRWKCLLGNPLPHPTIMIRRDLLLRYELQYDTAYRSAQDYELWTRLLPLTRAANIARPLLKYRIRQSSISRQRPDEQLANHDRIALLANRRLLPCFPLSQQDIVNLRARYGGPSVRAPQMEPSDPQWSALLRRMLRSFEQQYSGSIGLDKCIQNQQQWISRITAPATEMSTVSPGGN